ncbi:hypothetical protein FQA39_LY14595 [Lamprigera yunnana]|nr:hypothetical protein FQA39_LY14595 [Lamprigera yunnana]
MPSGNNGNGNRGWEIVTKNEVSDDGKRHASTKVATTSGSERIDKGVANYAAKCEQMSSQYEDGDADNFIKSNTSASKSVLSQEARGGDENNSFHSYSTSSNSSSKTVSQHYSGTESRALPDSNDSNVVRKIYTTDVPAELKRNPNYIDGNTTVTTETRTLPDGTKVTTTRYETKGVSKKIDQKHNYEQKSTRVDDTRIHHTVKQTDDFIQRNRYVPIDDVGTSSDKIYKTDVKNINERNVFKNKDNLDDVHVTKIIRETEYVPKEQEPSSTLNTENETIIMDSSKTTSTKNISDNVNTTIKTTKIVREEEYSPYKKQSEPDLVSSNEPIHRLPATSVPSNRQPGGYTPGDETPTNYKPQEPIPPQEIMKKLSPEQHTDNRIVVEKTYIVDKPKQGEQPSWVNEKVTTMTTQSTYKTDYTTKRISVDISPTHDAFARSLRASPDRDVKRGSTRSLKSSTSSLRTSVSPEKRYPDRTSPDRKQSKFPSKPDPKEPTPTSKSPKKDTTYEINTNTITRRRKVDSVDQKQLSTRTQTKISRSPSPTTSTSDIEYIKKSDITDGTTSRPDTLDFNKQPNRRTQPAPSPSSPSKNTPSRNKPLKRTDTYEERCKQILGISEHTTEKNMPKNIVPKEVGKREKSPDRSRQHTEKSHRKTPTKEPKSFDRKTSKSTQDNEHYVTKTVTDHTTVTTKTDKKLIRESPDETTTTTTFVRRGPSPDKHKPKEYLDDHDDKKPYSKSPSQPTKIPNAKGKSPSPDKFRPNEHTEDYDECNVTTVDRTQYVETRDKITKVPSSKGRSPNESPEDYDKKPYREFPDKSTKTPSSKQKSPVSDKFKPKETPEDYNKYPTTKTGKSPTDDDDYTPTMKGKRPKGFSEDNDNDTTSPGKTTKTPNIGRRSPNPDKIRPKESTEYYDECNVTTVDRTQYVETRDKITKVPSSKGRSPNESPEDYDKKPYREFPDKSTKTPSSKQKSPVSDKFKPKETPEDYNKYPTTKTGKSPTDYDEYTPTMKGKIPKEFPEDNDNDTTSPGKTTKIPNIGRSPSPDKIRPKESTEYYDECNVTTVDRTQYVETRDKITKVPSSKGRSPSPDKIRPKESTEYYDECNVTTVDRTQYVETRDKITKVPSLKGRTPNESPEDYDKKPYKEFPDKSTKTPSSKQKSPVSDKFKPKETPDDYNKYPTTKTVKSPTDDDDYTPTMKGKRPKEFPEDNDNDTTSPGKTTKIPNIGRSPNESPEDYDKKPYREFPDKSTKTPSSKQKSPVSDKFKPKETPEDYNKYPTTKTGKSPTDDDDYTPTMKGKRPKEFPEDDDNDTTSPGKTTKIPNIGRSPSPDKIRPKESTEYYDECNVTTVDRTQYVETRDKITKVPSPKGRTPNESPEDYDKKPYREFPDKSTKTPSSKQKSLVSDKFKPKETPEDYNKYPTTKTVKSPTDDDEYTPTMKEKRPKEFPEDNDNDTTSQGRITKTPNIGRRSPSSDKFRPKESTEYYDECNVTTVDRTQYVETRDKITKVPSLKGRTPNESPEDYDKKPYKEFPDKSTKTPSSKQKSPVSDKFKPKETPDDYNKYPTTKTVKSPTDDDDYTPTMKGKRPKEFPEDNDNDTMSPGKTTKTPNIGRRSPSPEKFRPKESQEDTDEYEFTRKVTVTNSTTKMSPDYDKPHKIPSKHKSTKPKEDTARPDYQPHDSDESYNIIKKTTDESFRQKPKGTQPEGNYPTKPKVHKQPTDFVEEYQVTENVGLVTKTSTTSKKQPLQPLPKDCNEPIGRDRSPSDTLNTTEQTFEDVTVTSSKRQHPVGSKKPGLVPQLIEKYITKEETERSSEKQPEDTRKHKITNKTDIRRNEIETTEINVSSHKTPNTSKKQLSEKPTPINKTPNKTSKVAICQPEDEYSTNKVTGESYVTETRKTTSYKRTKDVPDTSKEHPKKDVDATRYSSSDNSDDDEPVDTDGPDTNKPQKPKTRPSDADEFYSIHIKDARVISKLSKKPSPYESEPNVIDDDDYQPPTEKDVREDITDKTTVSQIVNKFNKSHKTPDRPEKRPTDDLKPRKPKPASVFEETVDIITNEAEKRRNKDLDDIESKKKPTKPKSIQPESFGVTVIDKCYLKEDTFDRKQRPRGQHPADYDNTNELPKNRRPSDYDNETKESSVTNIHHETKLFESLNAGTDVTEIKVKPRTQKPNDDYDDTDAYTTKPVGKQPLTTTLTKPGGKVKRPTDYDMPDESDYCKGSKNTKDSPQPSDDEYYTTDAVDKTQRFPKKPTTKTVTTSKIKSEGRPLIPDHVKRGPKPEEDKPKSWRQETIISAVSNMDKTSKKSVNTNSMPLENRIPKTYKSVTEETTTTKKVDTIDKHTTTKLKPKSSRPVSSNIRDGDDYYEPKGERPDSRTQDVSEYETVKTTTKTQRGSASPQKDRPKHRRPDDQSPECEDNYGEKTPCRIKTVVTRVKPLERFDEMDQDPKRKPAPSKQRPNYESPGKRVTEDVHYETNETTDRRTIVTKTPTKKVPTKTQEHPGRPKNEPVRNLNRTPNDRKTKNKSPERRKVNEPRLSETRNNRLPKTEYCSSKEKPRGRKPVDEVFTATKTYSTTDKATVHRVRQEIPSRKQPGTANDKTPRYKTKPDDEEYTSEEDAKVQKPYGSSREPTLSPERVCKLPDDFYTLNIKVYKTSIDTKSTKRFDQTSDNEEVDEKKRPRQLKSATNKPKPDKTDTIYRTVEKHYINKPAKPSTRTRTKPDESPDRRSHIKPVQKVISRRVTNTTDTKQSKTKMKPVETRHVVTTTIKVVPKNKGKPLKPVQPKRIEDDSDIEEYRVDGKDVEENRTYNRQLTHTISGGRPDSPTDKIKKQEKVITTKSIIINNDFENQRGVTVNLQRSTSSREATPDRSYVYLGSDNEDKGYPRYPDEICEPDDGYKRRIPTKLSDIPIIETEDTTHLSSSLNKVDDTDECLLSVNEKVNKFVNEAVKLTKPQTPDYSKNDRLNIRHDIPSRPKSPRLRNYEEFEDEETFTSVSKKVSHFVETAEKIKSQQKPTDQAPKQKRPEFTNVNETERPTSVSDKVKQFTIASRTSPDKKPVSLAKIDSTSQPRPKTDTDCVQIDSEDDTYTRAPSHPDREVSPRRVHKEIKQTILYNDQEVSPKRTPTRETSPRRTSLPSNRNTPKEHIYEPDSTPKSSRKPSDTKTFLSTTSRLRSTESVRKAKEIFENITKKQPEEKPYKKPQNEITTDLKSIRLVMDKINRPRTPSTDDNVPGYMRPLNRSPRPQTPRQRSQTPSDRSRSPSVEHHQKPDDPSLENIPHYMWPLDRSQHDHEHTHDDHESSPKSRESSPFHLKPQHRPKTPTRKSSDANDGVSHKISTAPHRKLTTVEIENILTTHEIEEIYDNEILEILVSILLTPLKTIRMLLFQLERATNYEQRRRIRSQIRIVKQLIIEDKLPTVITKKTPKDDRSKPNKRVTNEETTYTYTDRRRSSETKVSTETRVNRKSPEKTVFKTDLRKVEPISKKLTEEKPSWVTQRSLKKPGDAPKPKHSSTTAKRNDCRTSPSKEPKPTDAITSSYGVGPTDENGSPLFGLRALRAQTTTGKTKVQGTVIKSHYYSENGHDPIGEVSVTKYSTDPKDFEGVVDETNGLVSVTTTQKFGNKGTPSYKAIEDREDYEEGVKEERISRKSSSTSVTRRGSVKQMSKKFIDNAVETSKNERQSSYPKAGLILRTSSFKKEKNRSSSRESSPDNEVSTTTTTVRRTTTSGTTREGRSDTFLNNQTRVTSVQDVMTRMRNADNDMQEGDQVEDAEARKLLNKFIGSQVILSGMESCSSSPSVTTTKRTTTTSTSTKGGGKPTVVTRTFTHPITEEDLDTIWDEQTLKLLLERSTDYEERRIIRKRLRDVMAEKEVCADVTNEESSGRVEETIEKSKTEGPITTCQVTTRVTSQQMSKKPLSPFAKFRQLDKQNSSNTPPGTPRTPTGSTPLFKFTDPELNRQASTVKERLLQWCQMKTKEYENIQLDNFSGSWADGLAFCALIHHFLPDAFDYHVLTPQDRKHNFTLAFRIADEKADIVPLLDVEDMIATRKPDWKCVFTYVQTIYARFKNED